MGSEPLRSCENVCSEAASASAQNSGPGLVTTALLPRARGATANVRNEQNGSRGGGRGEGREEGGWKESDPTPCGHDGEEDAKRPHVGTRGLGEGHGGPHKSGLELGRAEENEAGIVLRRRDSRAAQLHHLDHAFPGEAKGALVDAAVGQAARVEIRDRWRISTLETWSSAQKRSMKGTELFVEMAYRRQCHGRGAGQVFRL
jgi:hypothetical protein